MLSIVLLACSQVATEHTQYDRLGSSWLHSEDEEHDVYDEYIKTNAIHTIWYRLLLFKIDIHYGEKFSMKWYNRNNMICEANWYHMRICSTIY